MKNEENGLRGLLENARRQLTKPFARTRRTLLIWVNLSYLCLIPVFLFSEKLATGHYVPHPILGWVYALVVVTNLVSFIYNYILLRSQQAIQLFGSESRVDNARRWDVATRWISVASILIMSFCNIIGLGNPSNDAIITDFALAHSLIIAVAILIGRSASFAWFIIVMGLLFYVAFVQMGYSYKFNYLTPSEAARYEAALQQNQPAALARQAELRASGLNPPTVSRYFDIWFVFILGSYLMAYFCMGITLDVFKVIPAVTEDIKEAINANTRQEFERERERGQAEEQRLLLQRETLSAELRALKAQINPHFLYNTLNYFYMKSSELSEDLAEGVLKLADIMRYSMQDNITQVSLDEEINYMNQFIDLHQMRNSHMLFINFTVHGPTTNKKIAPFLLIGLIENAFKHGKMNESDSPLIIRIEASESSVTFSSKNRKNLKKRVESNNIGLTNLRRRLALLYDKNYSFNIDQNEEFYSCKLIINA